MRAKPLVVVADPVPVLILLRAALYGAVVRAAYCDRPYVLPSQPVRVFEVLDQCAGGNAFFIAKIALILG